MRLLYTHPFEAGRGSVSRLPAGKVPDDPIACLNEKISRFVYLRRITHRLQHLREKPFARIFSAICADELLTSCRPNFVYCVRFRLRRVMFPELHPGMRILAIPFVEAKRGAIALHRQHGARSE